MVQICIPHNKMANIEFHKLDPPIRSTSDGFTAICDTVCIYDGNMMGEFQVNGVKGWLTIGDRNGARIPDHNELMLLSAKIFVERLSPGKPPSSLWQRMVNLFT